MPNPPWFFQPPAAFQPGAITGAWRCLLMVQMGGGIIGNNKYFYFMVITHVPRQPPLSRTEPIPGKMHCGGEVNFLSIKIKNNYKGRDKTGCL